MKFYKSVISMFMVCTMATTTVFAQPITQNSETAQQQHNEYGSFYIEGKAVVTKSSTVYNINPYNPATIEGLGESG